MHDGISGTSLSGSAGSRLAKYVGVHARYLSWNTWKEIFEVVWWSLTIADNLWSSNIHTTNELLFFNWFYKKVQL